MIYGLSGLALSADLRLDNREEVAAAVEIDTADDFSDAELVLKAYQRWDLECFEHLDGDWAIALWDGPRRRMILCRDRFGARPLNYFHDGKRLVAASDPLQVCADNAVGKNVHWGVFGARLCSVYSEYEETLYDRVLRLPAAHFAVVTERSLRVQRYWPSRPLRDIRFTQPSEYAAAYRETIQVS